MNQQTTASIGKRLSRRFAALSFCLLFVSCSYSAPVHTQETTRGAISYTLHSPAAPAHQRVILAHGFLRSPQTMEHLAKAFAEHGIETACIDLHRSRPWAGNHRENALDMISLRESLGWKNVTYAGFSAGGLSALIAASEDKACEKLLLLDPVDHGDLGIKSARKIQIPVLALLGKPGPGNAQRNASKMLAGISTRNIVEIPYATHCDFEAKPSLLCHQFTGSHPDSARSAAVHQTLLNESIRYLKN